jgi:hypothetical protein
MSVFTKLRLIREAVQNLKADWESLTEEQKLFRLSQIETALEIVQSGQGI